MGDGLALLSELVVCSWDEGLAFTTFHVSDFLLFELFRSVNLSKQLGPRDETQVSSSQVYWVGNLGLHVIHIFLTSILSRQLGLACYIMNPNSPYSWLRYQRKTNFRWSCRFFTWNKYVKKFCSRTSISSGDNFCCSNFLAPFTGSNKEYNCCNQTNIIDQNTISTSAYYIHLQ